ncbi:ZIP family metal transporter [Candidatus Xianfuyuplasma coldseepsis]|uniref:ZIP family metal transporter n=1 Tax=Candidatus Xianfuyuplasma coldseepsis TaxID=2782163 RepID=A0A7L7KQQ2_9MOLU|nr:ZIP family metal transporter [Xianfuyuplasma coldseepsis]QMS84997.1 ZIP family metal transporter [Xianfuyuplasma coldseepsis]
MFDWIYANPVLAALLGTLFTWGLTAAGSALVFPFANVSKKLFNGLLGFSAGVMIAASFWSLLNPAIILAEETGMNPVLQASLGFLSGGLFILLIDRYLPHMHVMTKHEEGVKSSWHRSVLLVLAITLHNIPEGLAVGVAFGYAATVAGGSTAAAAAIGGAVALAIGIGIQNFPEGAAVSVPLRREGMSKTKAFMIGQFSGMVEPIAGVVGALLAISMQTILPFSLSFAAGAMIYVVVEELIPESQMMETTKIATIGAMVGFVVMMTLDVALG